MPVRSKLYGSVLCRAERRNITYFTSDKADERADTSQNGVSVSDRKARPWTIPVSSNLTLPPEASDTPVVLSGAEALDVFWTRHSSTSRAVFGSVATDLFWRKSVLQKGRNTTLHSIVATSMRMFILTKWGRRVYLSCLIGATIL